MPVICPPVPPPVVCPPPPPPPPCPPPGTPSVKVYLETCSKSAIHVASDGDDAIPPVTKLGTPNWCSVDVCSAIDAAPKSAKDVLLKFLPKGVVDALTGTAGSLVGPLAATFAGMPLEIGKPFVALAESITGVINFAVGSADYPGECTGLAASLPWVSRLIIGLAQRWAGDGFSDQMTSLNYWVHYLCPTEIPSLGETHQAYLAGEIGDALWRCWVRANNACDLPAKKVVHGMRARPGAQQVVELLNKHYISVGEFNDRMRGLGTLEELDKQRFRDLSNFWAPPTDLIRFMVRDIFDPQIVAAQQLNAEFDQKFQGPAVAMAEGVGLSSETMRRYWQAHWVYPSAQAAYKMLHRLRPGVVPANVATTEAQVAELLGINDMAPTWRARLMAISFNPMRLGQIRKGASEGSLTVAQTQALLQDTGLSETNAYTVALQMTADVGWTWAGSKVGKAYLAGMLNESDVIAELAKHNVTPALTQPIIDFLVTMRKGQARVKCLTALRRRYMQGDLSFAQVQTVMLQNAFDSEQALAITSEWQCELGLKSTVATASKLCDWWQRGLLSSADFGKRLGNLGWSAADVQRIMTECKQVATKKAQAEADKAIKEAKKAKTATDKELTRRVRLNAKQERLLIKLADAVGENVDVLGPEVRQLLHEQGLLHNLSQQTQVDLLDQVTADLIRLKAKNWHEHLQEAFDDLVASIPPGQMVPA